MTAGSGAAGGRSGSAVPEPDRAGPSDVAPGATERLGIVAYTNVAPLHHGLRPGRHDGRELRFVHGVPSELNRALLAGEIDLTLISSVEFLKHADRLRALPDFSVATLGPVRSVALFHRRPWAELDGATVAVTTDSSTSVELLRVLFEADGLDVRLVPVAPDLDAMLAEHDGALLIGDAALREGVARRPVHGATPFMTDLGDAWYRATRLPFTFAVWASRDDAPPSPRLVAELRAARERGLGHLADVSEGAAERVGVAPRTMLAYLASFRYHLEPPDRDGLLAFAARVLPDLRPEALRYWDL